MDCDGSEHDLAQCRKSFVQSCGFYNQVRVVCSTNGEMNGIHITTMERGSVSILENVIMSNLSGVQVSGTPPTVVNVLLEDTQFGFVFVGRGIAKEKDVLMHNVTVRKVAVLKIKLSINNSIVHAL